MVCGKLLGRICCGVFWGLGLEVEVEDVRSKKGYTGRRFEWNGDGNWLVWRLRA